MPTIVRLSYYRVFNVAILFSFYYNMRIITTIYEALVKEL